MPKSPRKPLPVSGDQSLLKPRKAVPHAFVLDELASLSPYTRPMFGCLAIYVNDKIVLILRDKPTHPETMGFGWRPPLNITKACGENSRPCDR